MKKDWIDRDPEKLKVLGHPEFYCPACHGTVVYTGAFGTGAGMLIVEATCQDCGGRHTGVSHNLKLKKPSDKWIP